MLGRDEVAALCFWLITSLSARMGSGFLMIRAGDGVMWFGKLNCASMDARGRFRDEAMLLMMFTIARFE